MKLRIILIVFALSVFCLACMSPSDETVRKEFLAKHPNVEIVGKELIFEQDYVETYLIKYKETSGGEIKTGDFSLRRSNLVWRACDDQTEVKCK